MHIGKSIWLQIRAHVHQPHLLGFDEAVRIVIKSAVSLTIHNMEIIEAN